MRRHREAEAVGHVAQPDFHRPAGEIGAVHSKRVLNDGFERRVRASRCKQGDQQGELWFHTS